MNLKEKDLGKKYELIISERTSDGKEILDTVVELDDFDEKSLMLKNDKLSVVLRIKEV